ncbi:hypothetical protein Scep_030628 [Stephania cephalantha]|uniref:Protein kinase domain-containing protein n=1 Tax=Stephania cephalantha TaxID=152367 RepID=A0AAP0E3F3_9MAGN
MKRKTLTRKSNGGTRRSAKNNNLEGSLARHLTVQLGHVSLLPLQQHPPTSSSRPSDPPRIDPHHHHYYQQQQQQQQQQLQQLPTCSSVSLGDDDVEQTDFILSQDFFCTPDYITPDGQQLSNTLDFNKENIPCPKSPEKVTSVASKRYRAGCLPSLEGLKVDSTFISHEQIMELSSDIFGSDKLEVGKPSGEPEVGRPSANGTEKRQNYVSQSAVALRCRVMPPPCIINPYLKESGGVDADPFGNQRSKSIAAGLLPKISSGDGLSRYRTDFHEIEIAKALQFIHEQGIAHLDVKPDNIYVKKGIYKLGDFGCATLLDGSLPIEEGDARYMPQEILNDKYEHLDKVDIFSLGAAIYELVRRTPLPVSGLQFLNLREGKIPLLPGHSLQFQSLLKAMVDPDPVRRPSARELVENPIFDKSGSTGRIV